MILKQYESVSKHQEYGSVEKQSQQPTTQSSAKALSPKPMLTPWATRWEQRAVSAVSACLCFPHSLALCAKRSRRFAG